MVRWDQNGTFWPCRQRLASKEGCIQGKAPHTYRQICWWIIDALGLFCCQWSRGSCKINGIMNSTKYQDILAKNLVAAARKLRLRHRWIFQQDNEPKHTSKSTQKWFCEHKINVFQWSYRSLDLNPIENLWSELKMAVHKHKKGYKGFWKFLHGSLQMCSPTLINIIEIGSVSLYLPGEAAPSAKNRGADNCETFFFLKKCIIWKICHFGWFHWIISKVKYFPHVGTYLSNGIIMVFWWKQEANIQPYIWVECIQKSHCMKGLVTPLQSLPIPHYFI